MITNPVVVMILVLWRLRTSWTSSVSSIVKELELPYNEVSVCFKWLEEKKALSLKETVVFNNKECSIYDIDQKQINQMLENANL